jgi:hypothetical protein
VSVSIPAAQWGGPPGLPSSARFHPVRAELARCLIVNRCYREPDSTIRLISARRATAQEEELYGRLR